MRSTKWPFGRGRWKPSHRLFPSGIDPRECLAALHELEDEDVRFGACAAFAGASELLTALRPGTWALVTSNYEHRVRGRIARTGLPVSEVVAERP